MNILDIINEGRDYYNFEYYGLNDMATGIEAGTLINKQSEIINYFTKKQTELSNLDDFIDYMFMKKFVQFREVSPHIKPESKEMFDKTLEFLEKKFAGYKIKDLISYVNNNIEIILKGNKFHFAKEIFDIAFKYYSGCNTAILYLFENNYYLILDNFYDIENIINSNQEYKSKMLSTSQLDKIKTYRLDEYLDIIAWYKKNEKAGDKDLEMIIKEIIDYGNSTFEIINEDNAIQYNSIVNKIFRFLASIGHKEANVFEEKSKELEKFMDSYLKKHGQSFSYNIPYDKLLEPFKSDKYNWQSKILMLTHGRKGKSKKIESFYSQNGKYNKHHIADMCSSDVPHDDYFTLMKQQIFNLSDNIYLNILHYYVCNSRIKDFISYVATIVKNICDYYKMDYEELEFESDFDILLNMYKALFTADKQNNEYLSRGLNYGIILFECALIEKLLRNLYKNQNPDIYIKTDWCSLGQLLNPEDRTMLKFFNTDEIKVFRYYLIDGYNGKVGYNHRNNFAHYKNIKAEDMHFGISLKIMHILLTIINDIALTIK